MHVSWMKTFIYWDIWDCSFYKGTHCQILLKKLLATFIFMFWADGPVCHNLSIAFCPPLCPPLCSPPRRFHFILANEKHQQESKGQEEREVEVYTYSPSDIWLQPTLVLVLTAFRFSSCWATAWLWSSGSHQGPVTLLAPCPALPCPSGLMASPGLLVPGYTVPIGLYSLLLLWMSSFH